MVVGKFHEGDVPLPVVPAVISWNLGVQTPFFVLDTGFSGDIAVTEEMAKDLGLEFDTVLKMKVATGETTVFPVATVLATMEGKTLYVSAVLVKGQPLLGITFMQKFNYTAIVDCKNKTAILQTSP